MLAVLQRVTRASVAVDGETISSIKAGLLVLVGVAVGDTPEDAAKLAKKAADLRIFSDGSSDKADRFSVSLLDSGGEALVVSQFTLLADVRKGRRPSLVAAASPDDAAPLVDAFSQALRDLGVAVQTGRFGTYMQVNLENDGPVTILLETADLNRRRRGGQMGQKV